MAKDGAIQLPEKAHNGRLEPIDVLDRARDDKSILHKVFEWDDATAAEAHRLTQARELIRSIAVDIQRSNVEPPKPDSRVCHGLAREHKAAHDARGCAEVLARVFAAIDEARGAI